jgi:hypothetical protein
MIIMMIMMMMIMMMIMMRCMSIYHDVDVFKFTIITVIMHVMIANIDDHNDSIAYVYRCPSLFPQSSSR